MTALPPTPAPSSARPDRLALLSKASALLAASLDWETTLATVIDLALPALGDFGFFDVVEDEGKVRRVARAYQDPRRQAILDTTQWVRSERRDMNLCALSTGEPGLHAVIDDAWLASVSVNEGHLAVMKELSFGSMITVPLRYEQRLLGALTLFRNAPGTHFDPDDLAFGAELARRAAAAVENARLYRDLKRSEAIARRANEELREADRRKDEFLAMLGHELRNPLSPIFSALELMRTRAPDQLVHERTVIERQVQHLSRLVDDLLDVSRISRGAVVLERKPVELSKVITRAVELAQPLLEQRRHSLLSFVARTGLVVSADADRLAQVIANLLTNAAKYMDEGGVITLRGFARDGVAEVSVEDRGVGIAPELLPRIFDLFVQGERALDRPGGGLGVGLTIVKQLVTLHGGVIDARSDGLGRGSTFTVRLPLLGEAAVAEPVRPPPPAPLKPAPEVRTLRVMLVDDNRDGVRLMAELLRGGGFEVKTAYDGAAALQLAADFQPDVAVLDLGLPVIDGYQLARELQRTARFPLIAMTGYGQESDLQRTREAGFVEHLVKPVLYTDLVESVRRVAREARAAREAEGPREPVRQRLHS